MSIAAASTMQAIVQDAYGSVDVFRVAQIARPDVADNEVLVRVHAAGLDRGVWHTMAGKPYAIRPVIGLRAPRNPVPGRDVAGTVVARGSAVTGFAVGDEVYGIGDGTFAEYTVARESKLAHKPANLSFEQAAIVPVSALTALQGLYDIGHIEQGQHVLITGASGGVGTYAVQLAKAAGAEVTGVCSAAKADLVRSLGADHVLDYSRDDFADGSRHYDLILDIAGNPTLSRLRRALTATGTAVITGGEHGGQLTGMSRGLRAVALSGFIRQRLAFFIASERATDLERLSTFIETGRLTPCVDRTFPLNEVADAMRYLEAGNVRGKVAITS